MNASDLRRGMSFLEALEEHLDAIRMRDIDRFDATLAKDDVRFVGGDGRIIEGRENAVAAHRDWFMDDRWTFDPEILWTREEAGAAWALTRVTYRERESERQFLLLFLFVQEQGEWRLVYDQNTPIA
jgi:ketosteroid isomerase-like protein